MRRGLLAFALLLVIAGCATAVTDRDEAGPTATVRGDAIAGADLYARSCAACHGADLGGTTAGPTFLDRVYEPSHHADAAFQLAVARGVPQHHWDFGAMPPIPSLSESDVADITAYVRQEQRAAGIE